MRILLLILPLIVFCFQQPAQAKIRQTKSSTTSDELFPMTIGSSFVFENNSEVQEYNFPIFFGYRPTESLEIMIEPNFVYIHSKTPDEQSSGGFGDLETSVEYELFGEELYWTGLSVLGLVKWPTASPSDLGNSGRDYSMGLTISKDLDLIDLDLNALYTIVGDPSLENSIEFSLGLQHELNDFLDIEGEVVTSFGTGGIRGQPGSIASIGDQERGEKETEGTLGLAWHINDHFKFEHGGILKNDLSWQIVAGWEYNF